MLWCDLTRSKGAWFILGACACIIHTLSCLVPEHLEEIFSRHYVYQFFQVSCEMFNDFMCDVRHTDDLWLVLERSAVVAVIVDAALERSVLGSLCVNYTSQVFSVIFWLWEIQAVKLKSDKSLCDLFWVNEFLGKCLEYEYGELLCLELMVLLQRPLYIYSIWKSPLILSDLHLSLSHNWAVED